MGSPEQLTLLTGEPARAAVGQGDADHAGRLVAPIDGWGGVPAPAAWALLLSAATAQAVLVALAALACWSLVPVVFGLGSSVVMSDSMAPGIRAGDVVITRLIPAAQARPGQVLLVDDPDHPGRLRLHRLVRMRHGAFVLRGDANPAADSSPVPVAAMRGTGFLRVPFIGLPVLWLRTGQALPVAALSMALLAVGVLADLPSALHRRTRRRHRADPPNASMLRRRTRFATSVPLLLVALLLGQSVVPGEAHAAFAATTVDQGNTWGSQSAYVCLGRPTYTGTTPYLYWQYSEGTGSAVADSGSGHPGTSYGTVNHVPGSCSGSSPAIDISSGGWVSSTTTATTTTSFTIATWVRLNSTAVKYGRIIGLGDSAMTLSSNASVDRLIYLDGGGAVHFGLRMNGTPCDLSSASSAVISNTSWHHVAVTYSVTNGMRIILDGVLKVSTNCGGTVTTPAGSYWRVGYDSLSSTDWPGASNGSLLNGQIDQTTVWNTELTEAQVNTVYGNGQ